VEAAQTGDLRLESVYFSYPTRPGAAVLRDLSLTLPRGKVTAIVGRSGAGKSTVAALLERLYTPDAGSITLGGEDIRDFTRTEWCAALAAVSQEPVLFPASIAYNIGYGRSMRCSQEEIEAAAKAANAHEFIVNLPDGYATVVGEAGSLLSGGQRQRIALARALLKDAPILILDEATSSLDAENERLVQAAIDKLMEGRTVMVIAHRLSTVQTADQIVVLEGGQVVEQGSHKQLLRRPGGRYAALVSAQELLLQQT
jgi:ATP-binding cassette subfamily B (MDR/TAP) protein 8